MSISNSIDADTGRLARIMLVDDNDNDLKLTEMWLARDRVNLVLDVFTSPWAVLRELARMPKEALPDVIMIDLNMPEMMGLDLLLSIRRKNLSPSAVIGIATGSEDPVDRAEAIECGADFFVKKPINTSVLTGLCRKMRPLTIRSGEDGAVSLVYQPTTLGK